MADEDGSFVFCTSCGSKQAQCSKFCWKCGSPVHSVPEDAGPSSTNLVFGKPNNKQPKSFEDYMNSKKKQVRSGSQFRSKRKFKQSHDEKVTINIGLMKLVGDDLKPIWGKRLPVQVPRTANYAIILCKGIEKWQAFDRKFVADEDYVLLYEDGSHAICMPGQDEDFELEKYKTELGRDYKRITMYLCTSCEVDISEGNTELVHKASKKSTDSVAGCSSNSADAAPGSPSEVNTQPSPVTAPVESSCLVNIPSLQCNSSGSHTMNESSSIHSQQILDDENIAKMLQEWDNNVDCFEDPTNFSSIGLTEASQVVQLLSSRADKSQQFFLVCRRLAPFTRTLALWQRQSKKTPPTAVLRVQYIGEAGIDTGAMSQEFLTEAISNMGKELFPDGSPVDSTYHVQNGNFRTCGEIVAVSLAQGGPPPCFLEHCVYNAMLNNVDMVNIQEKDLTKKEQVLLNNIRQNPHDYSDIIFEHGYTGPVDEEHCDEICRSLKVSLVNRWSLYMREVFKGMSIYGLQELIQSNPSICQQLFVCGNFKEKLHPDANYLYSIMTPQFSPTGSSRRLIEENIMDHFQDWLCLIEDGNIVGHSTAIAWNYEGQDHGSLDNAMQGGELETFQHPDVTVAGVMGWLTGQKHKPIDNQEFKITVNFNHDCLKTNPNHRICFPLVGACAKEITIPVEHIHTFDDFKELFVLAFCKGQAFANP